MHCAAEHLVAAAQADHLAAVAQVARHRRIPALHAQPVEVAAHRLGAGEHDQVGRRQGLAGLDPGKIDLRMQAQRIEVVVVGGARIGQRDGAQFCRFLAVDRGGRDRVLGVEHQPVQIGQNPEHRFAGAFFEPAQPGFEQRNVAAKTVDHETLDPRLLGR